MKIETIFVTNRPWDKNVLKLESSLEKYGYEYTKIESEWRGFYTKVNEAYKYAKTSTADYILFVDCHDLIVTGSLDDIKTQIEYYGYQDAIFSTEKAQWPPANGWPNPELVKLYPESESQWKYLNSGSYLMRPQLLVELVETEIDVPFIIGLDDQMYWAHHYLLNQDRIILDTECRIFQTLAHDDGSSFDIKDGKFTNKLTGSNPVVAHGNATSWQLDCYKEFWG